MFKSIIFSLLSILSSKNCQLMGKYIRDDTYVTRYAKTNHNKKKIMLKKKKFFF